MLQHHLLTRPTACRTARSCSLSVCPNMGPYYTIVVICQVVWRNLAKSRYGTAASAVKQQQPCLEVDYGCVTGMHFPQLSAASPEGHQPGSAAPGGQSGRSWRHSAGVQSGHHCGGPDCTVCAPLAAGWPSSCHLGTALLGCISQICSLQTSSAVCYIVLHFIVLLDMKSYCLLSC